jgi:hypothetical protein
MYEKILKIYPELKAEDFSAFGIIIIQNDSDGKGDYIKSWSHPTYTQPTQAQLDAVTGA